MIDRKAGAKLDRILVPTDFSEPAIGAIRYASELARRIGARITLLYSDPFLPPVDYMATVGSWDETTFAVLKENAKEQLKHEAEANIDSSVGFEIVLRVESAIDGILAQTHASGAGLIVMGTHGRTGFRRLAIGSVTEAVVRRAPVPVIAVPPHCTATPSIETVVFPVMCNEQCLSALTFAAAIVPESARFVIVRTTLSHDLIQSADDLAELHAWVPKEMIARCEFRIIAPEHVAEQTEALARSLHADLIVAVEPGDRTATSVVYGTFAVRLVQRADCPVLTVNGTTATAALRFAEQAHRTDVIWANQ